MIDVIHTQSANQDHRDRPARRPHDLARRGACPRLRAAGPSANARAREGAEGRRDGERRPAP